VEQSYSSLGRALQLLRKEGHMASRSPDSAINMVSLHITLFLFGVFTYVMFSAGSCVFTHEA
jgi:hypothetical protein